MSHKYDPQNVLETLAPFELAIDFLVNGKYPSGYNIEDSGYADGYLLVTRPWEPGPIFKLPVHDTYWNELKEDCIIKHGAYINFD